MRDPLNEELDHLRATNKRLRQMLDARREQIRTYTNLIDSLNAKIADNERCLKPLLDLEAWLMDRIKEVNIAYQKTREIELAKLDR